MFGDEGDVFGDEGDVFGNEGVVEWLKIEGINERVSMKAQKNRVENIHEYLACSIRHSIAPTLAKALHFGFGGRCYCMACLSVDTQSDMELNDVPKVMQGS